MLGFKKKGTTKVRVRYLGPAPLDDKGSHLRAMNQELMRGTPLKLLIAAADFASRQVAGLLTTPDRAF